MFLIVLGPFTSLILYLQGALNLDPAMSIAFAHGTFNVMSNVFYYHVLEGLYGL